MAEPVAGLIVLKISNLTCRLCFKQSEDGKSLFDTLDADEKVSINHKTFADELFEITKVPVFKCKGLPHLICHECIMLMHQAYTFNQKYTMSHSILQSFIATDTTEAPEVKTTDELDTFTELEEEQCLESENVTLECLEDKSALPRERYNTEEDNSDLEFAENFRKLYKCKYEDCDKVFTSTQGKYKHMKTFHRKETSVCSECGAHVSCLKEHMMTHNIPMYQCDQCEKRFKTKVCLRHHLAIHSEERPFVCSYCGIRIKTAQLLRSHERTHIQREELPCPSCNKTFYEKHNLRLHMARCKLKKNKTDTF